MRISLVLAAVMLATGCTKIHFDQAAPVAEDAEMSQSAWHHNMVFSLVEVSQPVDLGSTCGSNDWESVKTETSVLNGLIGWIPYVSAIWTPKTVTVQCEAAGAEADG
ncbi:MAG: Bor/Iss family lipoprotein [Gammaproteobacteria bacterium]